MCLYVDSHKEPPGEPLVFWKIVTHPDRKPPRFAFKRKSLVYSKGTIIRAEPIDEPLVKRFSPSDMGEVHGGVIHLFQNEQKARSYELCLDYDITIDNRRWLAPYVWRGVDFTVIRLKCLPQHWIAWGMDGDVCYTQVEVLD